MVMLSDFWLDHECLALNAVLFMKAFSYWGLVGNSGIHYLGMIQSFYSVLFNITLL